MSPYGRGVRDDGSHTRDWIPSLVVTMSVRRSESPGSNSSRRERSVVVVDAEASVASVVWPSPERDANRFGSCGSGSSNLRPPKMETTATTTTTVRPEIASGSHGRRGRCRCGPVLSTSSSIEIGRTLGFSSHALMGKNVVHRTQYDSKQLRSSVVAWIRRHRRTS